MIDPELVELYYACKDLEEQIEWRSSDKAGIQYYFDRLKSVILAIDKAEYDRIIHLIEQSSNKE